MQSSNQVITKKSYVSPQLAIYGTIRNLTQNTAFGNGTDNVLCGTANPRSVDLGGSCPT